MALYTGQGRVAELRSRKTVIHHSPLVTRWYSGFHLGPWEACLVSPESLRASPRGTGPGNTAPPHPHTPQDQVSVLDALNAVPGCTLPRRSVLSTEEVRFPGHCELSRSPTNKVTSKAGGQDSGGQMQPFWEAWPPPINPTVPDLYQGTLPGTLTRKHAGERVCSEPSDAARGKRQTGVQGPGKTDLEPAALPYHSLLCLQAV